MQSMSIEQAVATLNAHQHRGRSDWRWDASSCEVRVPTPETMAIHPTDAVLIATCYWHRLHTIPEPNGST